MLCNINERQYSITMLMGRVMGTFFILRFTRSPGCPEKNMMDVDDGYCIWGHYRDTSEKHRAHRCGLPVTIL